MATAIRPGEQSDWCVGVEVAWQVLGKEVVNVALAECWAWLAGWGATSRLGLTGGTNDGFERIDTAPIPKIRMSGS